MQPLISDQTGKQVKAAFGELSEAFAGAASARWTSSPPKCCGLCCRSGWTTTFRCSSKSWSAKNRAGCAEADVQRQLPATSRLHLATWSWKRRWPLPPAGRLFSWPVVTVAPACPRSVTVDLA